jgi:hypothetical protein
MKDNRGFTIILNASEGFMEKIKLIFNKYLQENEEP